MNNLPYEADDLEMGDGTTKIVLNALSADRNGMETQYMTLAMRDLENREMGMKKRKNSR